MSRVEVALPGMAPGLILTDSHRKAQNRVAGSLRGIEGFFAGFSDLSATIPFPSHASVPQLTWPGSPVTFARLATVTQARIYAARGFHAALTNAEKAVGDAVQDRFINAANIYQSAYEKSKSTLPETIVLGHVKAILSTANSVNDQARAMTGSTASSSASRTAANEEATFEPGPGAQTVETGVLIKPPEGGGGFLSSLPSWAPYAAGGGLLLLALLRRR